MPFYTTIPKRIQTMWVQYGLLLPPPSACLKPQILPTSLPTLFLQVHPTQLSSWPPQCCCPLLRSQAPGLSVCVSDVTLLYGELVWQSRGRPTCMWQWLQLSSPSLICSVSMEHCVPEQQGFLDLSTHGDTKTWVILHVCTPGRNVILKNMNDVRGKKLHAK